MKQIRVIAKTDWEKWRIKTFYTKEPETIAWIRDFDDNCVFWDIGANIGIYSLFCAAVHPLSRIHAFEPQRSNFIRLWENIWSNNFQTITAHYLSIGLYDGDCIFEIKNPTAGSSGGQASNNNGIISRDLFENTDNSYIMPIRKGDSFISLSLGYEQFKMPNYIKIDTDGNEYQILLGMRDLLSNPEVKSILIEINRDHDDICKRLRENYGFVPDDRYNKLKTRKSDHNMVFRRK